MTATLPIAPLSVCARRAAASCATGVAVLNTRDTRITVSSLQWVSFDPPWVSVAIDRTSTRGQALCATECFDVRVLDGSQRRYARDPDTVPLLEPGLVELACVVRRVEPVGDHDLVLAEVTAVRLGSGRPLVYWRREFFELHGDRPWLASPETFRAFVADWESGVLPKAAWTHAAHVAVAACYRVRFGDQALSRTRDGIRRYNTAVGTSNTDTSGYHETLTRFWSAVIATVVADAPDDFEAARIAVARFGEDRDLHTLYYGFDVVRSVEARRAWMPPDLQPPAGLEPAGPAAVALWC